MKLVQPVATALVAIGLLSAVPAQASKIVYLECQMTDGDQLLPWQFALDEAAQTVAFEHPMGSGVKRGTFTSTKVIWNDGRMEIDRTTLTFSRTALGLTDKGQCKVMTPPKRAF